jgi:hypothetical protein
MAQVIALRRRRIEQAGSYTDVAPATFPHDPQHTRKPPIGRHAMKEGRRPKGRMTEETRRLTDDAEMDDDAFSETEELHRMD